MRDCHPWVALLAFAVILFFAVRNALWILRMPPPADGEETGWLGPRARRWYRECMGPLEEMLVRAGAQPDSITYSQAVLAVVAAVAFGQGAMFLGGWLVIASGTLDVLDGSVARSTGLGTPRGAFVDSVVDRYAEIIIYGGLAVYFRGSWIEWSVWLAAFGSMMVSYARARAEGLGLDCPVGGAQRAERVVLLGFGAFLSAILTHLRCAWGWTSSHGLLASTLVAMAVIVNLTALERSLWVARRLRGAK
jgi:CDP-diacylglycerol--glycerol-3-phosphate 3-phosphatidyltransferase